MPKSTSSRNPLKSSVCTKLFAVAIAGLTVAAVGCGGGGDDDDDIFTGRARITGQGFLPASAESLLNLEDRIPVANTEFLVVDLEQPDEVSVVTTGTTDAEGRYDVEVDATSSAAIIINGPVRVSGLVNVDRARFSKDFNSFTDIACEAGVTSVRGRSITAFQLNAQRIENLERAAQLILSRRTVDFTIPADVSAAAVEARLLTNDGADEPDESRLAQLQ